MNTKCKSDADRTGIGRKSDTERVHAKEFWDYALIQLGSGSITRKRDKQTHKHRCARTATPSLRERDPPFTGHGRVAAIPCTGPRSHAGKTSKHTHRGTERKRHRTRRQQGTPTDSTRRRSRKNSAAHGTARVANGQARRQHAAAKPYGPQRHTAPRTSPAGKPGDSTWRQSRAAQLKTQAN